MQRVFSDPNSLIVGNIYNLLERDGIEVVYRNEDLMGGAGELPPGEAWLEVWIVNDADADRAAALIRDVMAPDDRAPWICDHCQESNPPSFEICWHCAEPAGSSR